MRGQNRQGLCCRVGNNKCLLLKTRGCSTCIKMGIFHNKFLCLGRSHRVDILQVVSEVGYTAHPKQGIDQLFTIVCNPMTTKSLQARAQGPKSSSLTEHKGKFQPWGMLLKQVWVGARVQQVHLSPRLKEESTAVQIDNVERRPSSELPDKYHVKPLLLQPLSILMVGKSRFNRAHTKPWPNFMWQESQELHAPSHFRMEEAEIDGKPIDKQVGHPLNQGPADLKVT